MQTSERPGVDIPEAARRAGRDALAHTAADVLTVDALSNAAVEAAAPLMVAAELEKQADKYRDIAGALDRFDSYWTGKAEGYDRVVQDLRRHIAELRGEA